MEAAKRTFPRAKRLVSRDEFTQLLKNGKNFRSPCFYARYQKNGLARSRLGLIVSKRNVRRAVDRNRLKRTFRETFRHFVSIKCHYDIIFLANPASARCDPVQLVKAIAQFFTSLDVGSGR